MTSKSFEKREAFISTFIHDHARSFLPEDKEDLRQEIYVALLKEDPLDNYQEYHVNLTALRVLEEFRANRYDGLRNVTSNGCDHEVYLSDPRTPKLDLRLDIEAALKKLPENLRDIAEDLFYRGLTQEAVAEKHNRTQAWASKTKKRIQKLLSNSL
jgi:DNA-directed RNA polymerase specialized sigma24 family protein